MSETFHRVLELVQQRKILISSHGYDELAADGIAVQDILASILEAVVVEDYPQYAKGPCVLLLQKDKSGNPIYVVWGIPKGKLSPAVVVTAYRPEQDRWSQDFRGRKS